MKIVLSGNVSNFYFSTHHSYVFYGIESMKNPTRRNRNIGTAKQGYSQDNELIKNLKECKAIPFERIKKSS